MIKEKNIIKVIVTLTSYPKRIKGVSKVLDSIMTQTYKPNAVILYLSDEQFLGRSLPVDLSIYYSRGLKIHWCQGDMKSHKKYLYALKEFPNDYIITVDDDYYYDKYMIEELIQYVDKFPQCVLARRTHLITAKRDGGISLYARWWAECMRYVGIPRMDLFAVGCGGILYPPHLLIDEIFNVECIKKYCMYADDVWLKVMELISGIPVVQVSTRLLDRPNEVFIQEGLYQQYNRDGGNDRQFQKILENYNYFCKFNLTLTEMIFLTGIIYEDEVLQMQRAHNIQIVREWLDKVCGCNGIVIYGAGAVAKRIYKLLKKQNVIDKIKFFAVKDTNENENVIENVKVVQYKFVDYTNVVCVIALSNLKEQCCIGRELQEVGLSEDQILFLNEHLFRALRDFEKIEI